MGTAAGREVATVIKRLLENQKRVRMVFAAAPSQNEFLNVLASDKEIDWSRITAFHMDEYIGLSSEAPQRFGTFLKNRLFNIVQPGEVHLIDGSNALEECRRYSGLITESPIDIVCLGIGENGHIAFNDPPVANFADPEIVKVVELEEACRRQQVNDGCFPDLSEVPTHALTLTIPALMAGKHLFCMVPGATKHEAVRQTLTGPIAEDCPASILRTHPDCRLYLDKDSYGGEIIE